jgi:hypothetical protein
VISLLSVSLFCVLSLFVFLFSIWPASKVKVKVTLRPTFSQSVSLGIKPHLGLMTRYLFLFDDYVLVSVERPLWREDGSVFCMCRWPSGPSPLVLATIFYCLIFVTLWPAFILLPLK